MLVLGWLVFVYVWWLLPDWRSGWYCVFCLEFLVGCIVLWLGLGLVLLVACVFVGADCFWWFGCWFGSFAGGDVCSGWVAV